LAGILDCDFAGTTARVYRYLIVYAGLRGLRDSEAFRGSRLCPICCCFRR
jgi:hypothetical protein